MSISHLLNAVGRALGPALLPKPGGVPLKGNPSDWIVPKPSRIPTVPRPSTIPPPQPQPEPPGPPRLPRRGVPRVDEGSLPDPEPQPEELPAEPDPETDTGTEGTKAANVEDEQECATCEECDPRQQGSEMPQSAPQNRPEQKRGYDYQHWVCPWHAYDPPGGRIWEWNWFGVSFDGLHPAECHLFEAKHGYDGFLRQDDWSPDGRPKLQKWAEDVFDMIQAQARRQHDIVKPHYPNVRLTWVFSSMTTKLYLYEVFTDSGWTPIIEAEVRPFKRGDIADE